MKIFVLFITFLIFFSCNQKTFNSKEELLQYLQNEENGYIQKKTVNGVDFSLMYKPTDLLVSQMLLSKNINNIDSLRKKHSDYLYFNLSISKNNQEILNVVPKNRNEYGYMVTQLSFGLGEKVHLYTNNRDTIQIAEYVYPRMYGMGKYTSVLFVFPKVLEVKEAKEIIFTLEDLGFNTGEVKFKLSIQKIIEQPRLSLNLNK